MARTRVGVNCCRTLALVEQRSVHGFTWAASCSVYLGPLSAIRVKFKILSMAARLTPLWSFPDLVLHRR
jgi:hypothetical protein